MGEKDFIVDDAGAMIIRNGTFLVGESLHQEVSLLLLTSQGELKYDPLAGCNLIRRLNSPMTRLELRRVIQIQLERDGKNWEQIKDGINTITNG